MFKTQDRQGAGDPRLSPEQVKGMAIGLGADLCGIASTERFEAAPRGFRPRDVYPRCRSVIVFAKRLPPHVMETGNRVPYTHAMDVTTREVDEIGLGLCGRLADQGINAVPVPADDPYEHWEPARYHGRGILSLRHAGYLAGLGLIGYNNLLVNEKYGNMILLGAVLADLELRPDNVIAGSYCPPDCKLCLRSCPQKALDGVTVDQQKCRQVYRITTPKGYSLINCNVCRKVCPNRAGVKKTNSP